MNEPVVNTHVILGLEEVEWLDQQCIAIRRQTGTRLSRSTLLRGIVNGISQSGIDFFSLCRTEEDIGKVFAFMLQARHNPEVKTPGPR